MKILCTREFGIQLLKAIFTSQSIIFQKQINFRAHIYNLDTNSSYFITSMWIKQRITMSTFSQNFGSSLSYQNGMLKLCSRTTISCYCCPVVRPCNGINASHRKNRLCNLDRILKESFPIKTHILRIKNYDVAFL